MGKQQYSEEEILDYIGEKFLQNQALYCTIKKEDKFEITLRFKPLDKQDLRNWFRPVPFPKLIKEQRNKLLVAVSK